MIKFSLSNDLLKAWQRYTIIAKGDSDDATGLLFTKSNLALLIEFFKREVSGEESLKLARSDFEEVVNKEKFREKPHKRDVKLPTAAGLFNAKENTYLYCNKSHESKDCITVGSLPLQEWTAEV